jgi:antitoxin Phd
MGDGFMNINIDNLVSISEANQNFSKVARLVDEKGTALILKNNAPRYVLLDYNLFRQNAVADDADVDSAAISILAKHIKAFEELAK